MNSQLSEINSIIRACDEMVAHIYQYGSIHAVNDYYYAQYRKLIDRFESKYDLEHSGSVVLHGIFTILKQLFWTGQTYTVNLVEAQTILQTVVRLKHELYPHCFEKIFISHSEKDKEQTDAFIELLYAIGIQRPLANGEKTVFCSSHAAEHIDNGVCNSEEIKRQLLSHEHTLFILWYTENYFLSQPCLNECGAIWVLGKPYQEILYPDLDRSKINGFFDKRIVSFRSNDSARLNDFKVQLEQMFNLPPISLNAWDDARSQYINKINSIIENNTGGQHLTQAEIEV